MMYHSPKLERYFKENNKDIIEAIIKDDSEALSTHVLGSEEALNQEFGFDDMYLPRFLSSAPPIVSVAAFFNASNCVQLLIDGGADLKKKDLLGRTILHFAMASKNLDIVRVCENSLPSSDIKLTTPDDNGNQPMHVACEFGFLDGVKYIYLNCGSKSLVALNNSLTLPLLVASYNGHLDIIQYLKSVGINILDVDCNGLNALHYACAGGQSEVAKYLIENGINIDRTGHDSDIPILYAAQNGNLETVKVLVEGGSNRYKQKNAKRSPLIEAAKFGHVDVIKYFVSKGADVNMRNSSDDTAFSVALDNEHVDFIKYLIQEQSLSMPAIKKKLILSQSLNKGDYDFFTYLYKRFAPLTQDQRDYLLNNFSNFSFGFNSKAQKQFKCLEYLLNEGVTFTDDTIMKFVRCNFYFKNCPKNVKASLKKMCPDAFTKKNRYSRYCSRW